MLHQGNGNEPVDGVYERERLRRRARKLGLRLVKATVRSQQMTHSATLCLEKHSEARLSIVSADDASHREREFDKCG